MKRVAFSLFFMPLLVWGQSESVSPCLHARIALVTDVSGSMKGLEVPVFLALSSFVQHLPIKRDQIEVGLMYFNSEVTWHDFEGDKESLSRKTFLHSARESLGGTDIIRTLSNLYDIFEGLDLPDKYLRIAIIITDGQFEEYQKEVIRLSRSLMEDLNVSVFIIHMGDVGQAKVLLEKMVGQGNYYGSSYTTLTKDIRKFGPCF